MNQLLHSPQLPSLDSFAKAVGKTDPGNGAPLSLPAPMLTFLHSKRKEGGCGKLLEESNAGCWASSPRPRAAPRRAQGTDKAPFASPGGAPRSDHPDGDSLYGPAALLKPQEESHTR